MAITYIACSTTTKASGDNDLIISKPSGTKDGDLLIAFIGVDAADTITAPAGWTEIYDDNDSNDVRGAAYYKIADGEGETYTFTIGGTGHEACGGIACYRGVNEANPINAYANRDDDNAISSPWATSVTTDVDGCQILVCIAQEDIYIYLPPSGYIEVWDVNRGISDGVSLTMAHKSQSSAGTACPSGCRFSETGGDTDDYVAGTVALEPMVDPHASEGVVHTYKTKHKFIVLG